MTRNHKKYQPRTVRVAPLKYRPIEHYDTSLVRSRRRRDGKVPLDLTLALDQTPDDPADYILDFIPYERFGNGLQNAT